jgi:hypothetical protein
VTETSRVSTGGTNGPFPNLDHGCGRAALAAIGLEALPNCRQVVCLALGRPVIDPVVVMLTGAVLVRICLSPYPALLGKADVSIKAYCRRQWHCSY